MSRFPLAVLELAWLPRVFGRSYWVWIWYGILVLGALGFFPSLYWGRRTEWRNLDEVLRGFGTICVSIGMILLLQTVAPAVAYTLLLVALGCFIAAFVLGRWPGEGGPPEEKDPPLAPPGPPASS
ncbi:MAG: hypothetical protein ACREMO_12040 [Gemmatimonadales bacterium]